MKKTMLLLAAAVAWMPFVAQANHGDERYCREFTREVKIGGKWQEAYGLACREEDGSWQIVGENDDDNYRDYDDDDYRRRRDEVVVRERVYVPSPSFGLNINLGGHSHYGYRNHHWIGNPHWRSYSWLDRRYRSHYGYSRENHHSHYSKKSHRH